jgi:peptide/nickel transport system permease protein
MTDITAEARPGATPEGGEAIRHDAGWRMILRAFVENKLALAGLILVVAVVLFCFVGPLFYHTNQVATNLLLVNEPPGAKHALGTDNLGYDILGRLMAGGQSSLEVGFAVALVATVIGVLYGVISGFFGGLADTILMRFVDILLAIPVVYLFIDLATEFKPTLLLLILVLSLLSWLGPARLVRGETLSLRVREYVEAVRTMGGRSGRIIIRHLVPNTVGTIVVNATFQVADAISILAVLSYFGFSLPPPTATWGGMLENGVNFLADAGRAGVRGLLLHEVPVLRVEVLQRVQRVDAPELAVHRGDRGVCLRHPQPGELLGEVVLVGVERGEAARAQLVDEGIGRRVGVPAEVGRPVRAEQDRPVGLEEAGVEQPSLAHVGHLPAARLRAAGRHAAGHRRERRIARRHLDTRLSEGRLE